uniref:Uncharacterized protein n=1 Tax=Cannabis sativa TaxID=3483 RepID=A0A803QBW3_CANSA
MYSLLKLSLKEERTSGEHVMAGGERKAAQAGHVSTCEELLEREKCWRVPRVWKEAGWAERDRRSRASGHGLHARAEPL